MNVITSSIDYRVKNFLNTDGSLREIFNATMETKGFLVVYQMNYDQTVFPILSVTAIQINLSMQSCKEYELRDRGVKSSFLYGGSTNVYTNHICKFCEMDRDEPTSLRWV